jgi:hypothetical protein
MRMTELVLQGKMVWAIIRKRSVCYRMEISPHGVHPLTSGSMVVQNRIHGLNTGIVLDLNSRRSIVHSNYISSYRQPGV